MVLIIKGLPRVTKVFALHHIPLEQINHRRFHTKCLIYHLTKEHELHPVPVVERERSKHRLIFVERVNTTKKLLELEMISLLPFREILTDFNTFAMIFAAARDLFRFLL